MNPAGPYSSSNERATTASSTSSEGKEADEPKKADSSNNDRSDESGGVGGRVGGGGLTTTATTTFDDDDDDRKLPPDPPRCRTKKSGGDDDETAGDNTYYARRPPPSDVATTTDDDDDDISVDDDDADGLGLSSTPIIKRHPVPTVPSSSSSAPAVREASSTHAAAVDVRKKRPRYTLDQLDEIATQVRDGGDALDVDERQRQMGIVYSKRKRLRAKIREQGAERDRDHLVSDNDRLRLDNTRLEGLLTQAKRIVAKVEKKKKGKVPPPLPLLSRPADATQGRSGLAWPMGDPNDPVEPSFLAALRRQQTGSASDRPDLSSSDLLRFSSTSLLHRPTTPPLSWAGAASAAALSSSSSTTSLRSLNDLQLLDRLRELPVVQPALSTASSFFGAGSSILPPTSSSLLSASSMDPPDLTILSRSYELLQQRLRTASAIVAHDEHQQQQQRLQHVNALLSATLPRSPPPLDDATAAAASLALTSDPMNAAATFAAAAAASGTNSSGGSSSLDSMWLLDGLRRRRQQHSLPTNTNLDDDLSLLGMLRQTPLPPPHPFTLGFAAAADTSLPPLSSSLSIDPRGLALGVGGGGGGGRNFLPRVGPPSLQHPPPPPPNAHPDINDTDGNDSDVVPFELLRNLPLRERLVLSRVDTMPSSDLLALFSHWKVASPVAAQFVAQCLRRRQQRERLQPVVGSGGVGADVDAAQLAAAAAAAAAVAAPAAAATRSGRDDEVVAAPPPSPRGDPSHEH